MRPSLPTVANTKRSLTFRDHFSRPVSSPWCPLQSPSKQTTQGAATVQTRELPEFPLEDVRQGQDPGQAEHANHRKRDEKFKQAEAFVSGFGFHESGADCFSFNTALSSCNPSMMSVNSSLGLSLRP